MKPDTTSASSHVIRQKQPYKTQSEEAISQQNLPIFNTNFHHSAGHPIAQAEFKVSQMTRDREVSDSIPIKHENSIEGPTIHNSYGSACYSYIHVNDSDPVNHTEDNSHEEAELADTSSRESVTPVPIDLLPGEKNDDSADFVDCRVVLTNFRLCILNQDQLTRVISLMSIDCLNFTDPNIISIVCKDGKCYRLTAPTNELAIHWHKRLMKCTARSNVGEAFAWEFAEGISSNLPVWLRKGNDRDTCDEEWKLLKYDPDFFQISNDNKDHSLIETYPSRIIVPKWMTKDDIEKVKDYRFLGRIPAIVYVHQDTKAVLLRSSQPKSGFLAWRNPIDEKIMQTVNEFTKKYQNSEEDVPPPDNIILDARSYAAAWANRAKGGGFENPDCYGNTKSMFLGLPNIHSVRYAFSQLRTVLSSECQDQNTYLHSVSQTQWLQHLGNLMNAANECMDMLQRGTSVLVHCSDGWDRTTQIVSLAKLFIDERYRTLTGFELLIRREWIEFGHKFADRNGVYGIDTNERCPVFLQWLDAVWQASTQNPTAFQFNSQYIIKLAQHVYSGLFGTFLFNSVSDALKDRESRKKSPISIWQFLGSHNEEIVNESYDVSSTAGRLTVKTGVQYLNVWKEFYYTELAGNVSSEMTAVISSPTLARSAASTPLKDIAPLQKSKSSESINSLGQGDPMQTSTLLAAHSESNGAINTSEHHPIETSTIMTESIMFKRDTKTRSLRCRKMDMKDLIDHDGMIKFFDPAQEVQRRKKQCNKAVVDKLNGKIADLSRHRSFSEKTGSSLGNRSRDRVTSGDDSELDNMSMDRAISDVSLVDNNDIPANGAGWAIEAANCALCRVAFSRISLRSEDREHHCRKCGKAVCDRCSPHTYHDVHEGKGIYLRACIRCYQQMECEGRNEVINEEEEDIGGGGAARPCSSAESMRRLDDSFASLNSGSLTQPVKG